MFLFTQKLRVISEPGATFDWNEWQRNNLLQTIRISAMRVLFGMSPYHNWYCEMWFRTCAHANYSWTLVGGCV